MLFEFDSIFEQKADIKVIGVGGAGGNAINRMINAGMEGVDFCVINTDAHDIKKSLAEKKINIGKNLTKGLGAGAKVELGRQAIIENRKKVQTFLRNTDMVVITAGMGGGTGTGAAPLVAEISKEMGILTVGIVTLPFTFEGPKRMARALTGVTELRKVCDTLLVIPNQKLMSIVEKDATLIEAFQQADSIMHYAIMGISDLINIHGMINLDFADVETIMRNMGDAIMGIGTAHGSERAVLAAQQAISSPLLDNASISGAQGILINITGGSKMTLFEVDEAASVIFEEAGRDANLIFGAVIDPSMKDEMRVTIIVTWNKEKIAKPSNQPNKNNLKREVKKTLKWIAPYLIHTNDRQERKKYFPDKINSPSSGITIKFDPSRTSKSALNELLAGISKLYNIISDGDDLLIKDSKITRKSTGKIPVKGGIYLADQHYVA